MAPITLHRTRERLGKMLQERNEYPERAAAIDQEITKLFGQTVAVMVMDMSGFSRQTLRHGIIHFLAQIHRMHSIAAPIVERHHGELIKTEADNIFAIFSSVDEAVAAAVEMDAGLDAANTMLPDEYDMYGEFGIGYGEILVIENADLFGSEMNLASKLGEDIAQRGEILLTESAYKQVASGGHRFEELKMLVSGIDLRAYKLMKQAPTDS